MFLEFAGFKIFNNATHLLVVSNFHLSTIPISDTTAQNLDGNCEHGITYSCFSRAKPVEVNVSSVTKFSRITNLLSL